MQVRGYYINLDREKEKRESFEYNLKKFNLREYQRFTAIEAYTTLYPEMRLRGGERACFLSHYTLIKNHDPKRGMLHVLEDDARLNDKIRRVHQALAQIKSELWDIVLTDVLVQAPPSFYSAFSAPMEVWRKTGKVQFYNMHQRKLTGATSYFVNPASHSKVAGLIQKNIPGNLPFDLLLRRLSDRREAKVLVTLPFFTYPQYFQRQTSLRELTFLERVLMKLRESFWVDADLAKVLEELKEFQSQTSVSTHTQIYGEFMKLILGSKQIKFPLPL